MFVKYDRLFKGLPILLQGTKINLSILRIKKAKALVGLTVSKDILGLSVCHMD